MSAHSLWKKKENGVNGRDGQGLALADFLSELLERSAKPMSSKWFSVNWQSSNRPHSPFEHSNKKLFVCWIQMPTREEKRPELSKAGGHSATPGVVTAEGVRMCVCVEQQRLPVESGCLNQNRCKTCIH